MRFHHCWFNKLFTVTIATATLVASGLAGPGMAAVPFSTLHQFTTATSNARSSLLLASDGNMYGLADSGNGMAFKVASDGTVTTIHYFTGTDGRQPQGQLVQGADGNLYGTTVYGGANDGGTIFEMTTAGVVTTLYTFGYGGNPAGGLIIGADGNFYCAAYDWIFKMTPQGQTSLVHTFGNVEGFAALAPLMLANDGNYYGTTTSGAASGSGSIFRMTPDGTVTNIHSFYSSTDGSYPSGKLVQGPDGALYGTTRSGGANTYGTIFRITLAGDFSVLYPFANSDGRGPCSELLVGSNNTLYGTASGGGDNYGGTIFKITTGGVLTTLYPFSGLEPNDPVGGLIFGSDGNMYGVASYGGPLQHGSVFKCSTSGTLSTVSAFPYVGVDGYELDGGLVRAGDGTFYGTTAFGGAHDFGSVFKMDAAGTVTILHSFTGTDGDYPNAKLTIGSDGNLYGSTGNDTVNYCGTLFKVTPTGQFTELHQFNGADGAFAAGPLVEGADGAFYGTTQTGGSPQVGVIFKITKDGTYSKLYNFGLAGGSYPHSGLTLGADGNFYGTTVGGGDNGYGAIFMMTPTLTVTNLYSFTNADGKSQGVVYGSDGTLYGTTGLHTGPATVYKLANGAFSVLHTLAPTEGLRPSPTLALSADGTLYGAATDGGSGSDGSGTIFSVTPAGTFKVLHRFLFSDGTTPTTLTIGDDQKLYGTTMAGGNKGGGVAFSMIIVPPTAPTNVNAVVGNARVSLTWTASDTATSYNIYRSTTSQGEGTTPIQSVASPSYVDTSLNNGTTYYYKITAVNAIGEGSASAEISATPVAPVVHFVKVDTTTLGNWKNSYGSEGYNVIGDTSPGNPHYRPGLTVTPGTHNSGIWAASSLSSSALQSTVAGSPQRIAGVWSNTTWTSNFNIAGTHQLALYLLDYPNAGYAETITIKDATTGAVLDTRSASGFQTGAYYVWTVTGNVNVTLTSTAGHWAVLSGIFFGGPSGSK